MEDKIVDIEKYVDEIDELLSQKTDLNTFERAVTIRKMKKVENGLSKLKNFLISNDVTRNDIFDFTFELEYPGMTLDDLKDNDTMIYDGKFVDTSFLLDGDEKDEYYADWNEKCCYDCKEAIKLLKELDIYNKKIKAFKMYGKDFGYHEEYFLSDLYNNNYMKDYKDFKKDVSLDDFPEDAAVKISTISHEPIQIIFEDDSTFEFMGDGATGIYMSENSLKNIKPKENINIDINKLFNSALGKKIIGYNVIPDVYDYEITSIELKLNDGNNLVLAPYGGMMLGSSEKGANDISLKEYLDCVISCKKKQF